MCLPLPSCHRFQAQETMRRTRTRSTELQPDEADIVAVATPRTKAKKQKTTTLKTPSKLTTTKSSKASEAKGVARKKAHTLASTSINKEPGVDYSRSSTVALLSACMSIRPTCFDATGSYLCVSMGAVVRVLSVVSVVKI